MHKNHYVKPLKHVRLDGDLGSFIYLGQIRDKYPGTDALAYEHDPILDFLKEQPSNTLVYGEGARITSVNFLQKVQDLGYKVTVVKLDIDETTAADRVMQRDGKTFDPVHVNKLKSSMQKIEEKFNFWSLPGVDSLAENTKHLGQIIAQINGVEHKETDDRFTEEEKKAIALEELLKETGYFDPQEPIPDPEALRNKFLMAKSAFRGEGQQLGDDEKEEDTSGTL